MRPRNTSSKRRIILLKLRELKIDKVNVSYSGSNDEGWVDDPTFFTGESNVKIEANVPVERTYWDGRAENTAPESELNEAVREMFEEILESGYGGWEINAGAFGKFRWDIKTDDIKHVHNQRHESYDTEERDL